MLYNWIAYEQSDKIALASVGAIPANPEEYYVLHNIVEEVALAAGIPKPNVYIMEESQPNAFATGKDPKHASVCVTTGLLQMMNREELQGVIAHEISHIRNRDILLMTVVAVVAGLIILLRDVMLRSMWWGMGESRRRDKNDNGAIILLIIGLIFFYYCSSYCINYKVCNFKTKRIFGRCNWCLYCKRSLWSCISS